MERANFDPHSKVSNNLPIMMIEDSDIDYSIALRSMKKTNFNTPVIRFSNGEEALEYLFGDDSHLELNEIPSMILLDLRLPGIQGEKVLEAIRESREYRATPVIILSTSNDTNEVNKLYKLGANSYIAKPAITKDVEKTFSVIKDFWYDLVRLPLRQI